MKGLSSTPDFYSGFCLSKPKTSFKSLQRESGKIDVVYSALEVVPSQDSNESF